MTTLLFYSVGHELLEMFISLTAQYLLIRRTQMLFIFYQLLLMNCFVIRCFKFFHWLMMSNWCSHFFLKGTWRIYQKKALTSKKKGTL